jgi:Glyoxalase-like domain
MDNLPALRQVVLLAADLPRALSSTRDFLGLNPGIRDADSMAKLGFEHEVLAIDQTFIEIVSPLSADSSSGRLLARRGEGGYMVVLQVSDVDAMVERAAGIGLKPILHEEFEGNPMTQWHPRDLGTLAELDEMRVAPWHFCPELSDTGSTAVASDIVSVDIAVPDPAGYAARWATLLGLAVDDGQTTLDLGGRTLNFVPAGDAVGLLNVRLAASDPGAVGSTATLCGVGFSLVTGAR